MGRPQEESRLRVAEHLSHWHHSLPQRLAPTRLEGWPRSSISGSATPVTSLADPCSLQHRLRGVCGGCHPHLAPWSFSREPRQYDAGKCAGPGLSSRRAFLQREPQISDPPVRMCFQKFKGWGAHMPVVSTCSEPRLGALVCGADPLLSLSRFTSLSI